MHVNETIKPMTLEMQVPPELNWSPVSQPPANTIDFVSPVPGNQDVILRLKENATEVSSVHGMKNVHWAKVVS